MNRNHQPAARTMRPNIPAYISQDGQNATSTGSNDSVMTQVPMPYHLSNNSEAYGYGGSDASGSPWATPTLPQSNGGFENFQGAVGRRSSSKSLNPNSSPYVPNFPSTPTSQGFAGGGQQSGNGSMYGKEPNGMQQFQPQRMRMENQQYGQYSGALNMNNGGSVGGFEPQLQNYGQMNQMQPQQGPYQHYGNSVPQQNNWNSSGPMSSPAMSYNSMSTGMSPTRGFQNPNFPYGPATGNGVAPAYSNLQQYQNYPNQQGFPQYNNGYSAVHPSDMHRGPRGKRNSFGNGHSNSLRPNGFNNMGKKRSVSDFHLHASDLGSRIVHPQAQPSLQRQLSPQTHCTTNFSNNNFSTPSVGGPVKPPTTAIRTGSPVKSTHGSTRAPSTRASSTAPTSRASEGPPTPGSVARPLDLSFQSEPRNTDSRQRSETMETATPRLRSRAGQSIHGLKSAGHVRSKSSIESVSRDTLNFFSEPTLLDNSEKVNKDGTQTPSKRPAPPKMLSLFNAGGVDATNLSPITEGSRGQLTPYSANQPRRGGFTDPFGPAPMLTPWTGTSHFGREETSRALSALTANKTRKPTVEEAMALENLPFVEYCRHVYPDDFGVIKIKNIPYGVARAEVMAFLGRNARIVDERSYEPVHIVMERVTSKTLDCYVEFVSLNEAVLAVQRFEQNRTNGRGGRLGQRHVEVELSSQEGLMKDLFPKAKNVNWKGGRPQIIEKDPNDQYNSGFQGFVSKEELVMLVKHVEAPQRSPFSKDCPQRPFECLISTLLKYPWYMVDYITIEDRNLLFKATKELLQLLVDRVHNEKDNINLTPMLLKRAWRAALRCPGFTPAQKDDIICICSVDDRTAKELGVAPYASYWKILWCIGPKPGVPEDLLLWYCAIIREATESKQEQLSLAERAARGENKVSEPKLFGDLVKYIHYSKECALAYQTLSEVAKAEWTAIEQVLRQALTPAIEG